MARRNKNKKRKGPSIADRADRHQLYERAVQSPDDDVEFFARVYSDIRGRAPLHMREDFCGTANLAVTWLLEDPARTALGIDFDGPTLESGRKRHIAEHAEALGDRLTLIEADVLEADPDYKADVACAMNFSYCVFKERKVLARYFERVLEGLADEGVLFLELYGGLEAIDEDVDEHRELDGFDYHWQQEKFDPITNETVCHIHFGFSDGSKIERAFTYEWRLWGLPELRDLLLEVGFSDVKVFWEETDDDDGDSDVLEGSGNYVEVTSTEQQQSWLVYIVALK